MKTVDAGGTGIERFSKQYCDLDSYVPEDYVKGAEPVLARMGWLARPITPGEFVHAALLIRNAYEDGLTIDDYPFVLLWTWLDTAAVREVPGLRMQLAEWRAWWEAEYDEILTFLPPLMKPVGDG